MSLIKMVFGLLFHWAFMSSVGTLTLTVLNENLPEPQKQSLQKFALMAHEQVMQPKLAEILDSQQPMGNKIQNLSRKAQNKVEDTAKSKSLQIQSMLKNINKIKEQQARKLRALSSDKAE